MQMVDWTQNETRRTRLMNSIRYIDDVRYGNALGGRQVHLEGLHYPSAQDGRSGSGLEVEGTGVVGSSHLGST